MSDELIASLLRSVIWAAAFVTLGFTFEPIVDRWVRKSLALRKQELKAKLLARKTAQRGIRSPVGKP